MWWSCFRVWFATFDPRAKFLYIKGLTENITRTLRTHDIRVTNKPLKTLQQLFPSPKFRPPAEEQTNVVYKIPCADCNWSYTGETGRSFLTRKKEHERNIKNFERESNVANHAWKQDHHIDFKNASIIDKRHHRIRKTLESWHTASTDQAENNSRALPGQY